MELRPAIDAMLRQAIDERSSVDEARRMLAEIHRRYLAILGTAAKAAA
jgi:hypothetical protein